MSETNPVVRIETSLGTIDIELNSEKAPATVKNFLGYVRSGFYENTVFHRVVPGFMIQGGGLTADLQKRLTRWAIKNEADNGLTNDRGTIAMARTQDVDSATAQFFINVVDNDFLNHQGRTPDAFGYAVFGRVVEGMDTVDKIQNVPTGNSKGLQDVPKEAVVIKRIEVLD